MTQFVPNKNIKKQNIVIKKLLQEHNDKNKALDHAVFLELGYIERKRMHHKILCIRQFFKSQKAASRRQRNNYLKWLKRQREQYIRQRESLQKETSQYDDPLCITNKTYSEQEKMVYKPLANELSQVMHSFSIPLKVKPEHAPLVLRFVLKYTRQRCEQCSSDRNGQEPVQRLIDFERICKNICGNEANKDVYYVLMQRKTHFCAMNVTDCKQLHDRLSQTLFRYKALIKAEDLGDLNDCMNSQSNIERTNQAQQGLGVKCSS